MTEQRKHFPRALGLICGVYFAASLFHASWGLPNGNRTWAADSVAPMTPLAVAYRTFVEDGANSGYFYFKYPIGHQLLLAAVTAPAMAVAYVRGDLHGISSDYPFGLRHADRYLGAMALIARLLSALFATGVVALVGAITARIYGARAGIFAAITAAGCYPLLFYAHTSNVETAFLFWAFLALYCALIGVEDPRPRALWVMGFSAAMAISTKEQILGFLVLVPVALLLRTFWLARDRDARGWNRIVPSGALGGATLSILTWAAVNAAFYNPAGFFNRIRFLTHTLPPWVRERYAAYEFPVDFSTTWTGADEISHLGKVANAVLASIGWPTAIAALLGIAYLMWKKRGESLYLLAAAAGYYVVSLRVLKQVELRYVLPWSVLVAIPAGVLLARLSTLHRAGRIAAVSVVVFGVLYAGEVLHLLAADARYAAEEWMQPHLEQGRSVEVYQSWTYLPRWEATASVVRPPTDAMSIRDVDDRRPEFIVISSKGKEGITMYPNPDWRDGRGMMLVREDNQLMLQALESGQLGYDRVQSFEPHLLVPRDLITSLAPAIDIYRRRGTKTASGLVTTGRD